MKKNKVKLILIIAALLIIAVAAGLILWNEPIVTGRASEVQSLTIDFIDTYNNYAVTSVDIESPEDIAAIFSLLKQGRTRTNRWPDHIGSMQLDSKAVIRIVYSDDHADEVRVASEGSVVFRFLDSSGGSGDPGFVRIINEQLYEKLLETVEKGRRPFSTGGLYY